MKKFDLDELEQLFRQKKISEKQLGEKLIEFTVFNYPLYGLNKYDDDFRGELYLKLVERINSIIKEYNPEITKFSTYYYFKIISLMNCLLKRMARFSLREQITVNESIKSYGIKLKEYSSIKFEEIQIPNAPYNRNKVTPEQIREAFAKKNFTRLEKTMLVLVLKSSFYLDDEFIFDICELFCFDKDLLIKTIDYCRNILEKKYLKKGHIEAVRNNAYFQHNLLGLMLDKAKAHNDYSDFGLNDLEKKYEKQTSRWINKNLNLREGVMYLRPTNKMIGELIGITERQVCYYLFSADKHKENLHTLIEKRRMEIESKS